MRESDQTTEAPAPTHSFTKMVVMLAMRRGFMLAMVRKSVVPINASAAQAQQGHSAGGQAGRRANGCTAVAHRVRCGGTGAVPTYKPVLLKAHKRHRDHAVYIIGQGARQAVGTKVAARTGRQQAGGEHQKPWQQQQQRRRPHQRQLPTLPKGQVWGSYVSRPRRQRHQQHQGGKPSCT